MIVTARTKATKRMTAVVTIENPDLDMRKAEARLVENGNIILARDEENRSFTVAQAIQEQILEAGTFVPDVEAVQAGLLPSDTVLVPCPDCRDGVAFHACASCPDSKGIDADGQICRACDGSGNDLGGPCMKCGGHAKIAEA